MFDTFAYLALASADWFHAQLDQGRMVVEEFRKLKQLTDLLNALNDSKSFIITSKDGKQTYIDDDELLALTRNILINKVESDFFFPKPSYDSKTGIYQFDSVVRLQDNLSKFSKDPINALRTVFISKIHEFISNETIEYVSKRWFTRKQRTLIYSVGVCLSIFPKDQEWDDNDYLKHIYRDNLKVILEEIKNKEEYIISSLRFSSL